MAFEVGISHVRTECRMSAGTRRFQSELFDYCAEVAKDTSLLHLAG